MPRPRLRPTGWVPSTRLDSGSPRLDVCDDDGGISEGSRAQNLGFITLCYSRSEATGRELKVVEMKARTQGSSNSRPGERLAGGWRQKGRQKPGPRRAPGDQRRRRRVHLEVRSLSNNELT